MESQQQAVSIIRLYDPTEGTILFNGEDISKKLTAKQEKMLRSDMQMSFRILWLH